jgi:hypothetical protein
VGETKEAEWRAEFERLGELLVYENAKQGAIYNDKAKRQAALRRLSDQAHSRRNREVCTLRVAWWTFFAAIDAVVVGALGVVVTLLH